MIAVWVLILDKERNRSVETEYTLITRNINEINTSKGKVM